MSEVETQPAASIAEVVIAYRTHELLPGRLMFDCRRLVASITSQACAENYGNPFRVACRGCAIGEAHAAVHRAMRADVAVAALRGAGSPFGLVEAQAAADLGRWCARCLRTDGEHRGGGMAKMRLVSGGLCVSCHNREREVIRGRDSKGMMPVRWRLALGRRHVGLVKGGEVKPRVLDLALNSLEVGIRALRTDPTIEALCWVSVGMMPADFGREVELANEVEPAVAPALPELPVPPAPSAPTAAPLAPAALPSPAKPCRKRRRHRRRARDRK